MYYDIPCLCRNPRNLVFKRKVKKQKKKKKEMKKKKINREEKEIERKRETIRKNETKTGRQIQTNAPPVSTDVLKCYSNVDRSVNRSLRWKQNERMRRKKKHHWNYVYRRTHNYIIHLNSSLHDAFVQSSRQFAYTREMQKSRRFTIMEG